MLYWFRFFFPGKISKCTVPKTFYFPTWAVVRRVNGEPILSERWVHSEPTVSTLWANSECIWTVNDEQTQSANTSTKEWWTHSECTMNNMWMLCEGKMNDLFGVPQELSLHCVSSVIKKNSMYCYEPKYNIIWLNDKWTLNEGECKVNALWAHAECTVIANGLEWRAQGNPQWTHWERRWTHRIIGN